jgi:hypothetical protein
MNIQAIRHRLCSLPQVDESDLQGSAGMLLLADLPKEPTHEQRTE